VGFGFLSSTGAFLTVVAVMADLNSEAKAVSSASGWGVATELLHHQSKVFDSYDAISPPLYQTATFKQVNTSETG
jgi:hypothetical protein